MRFSGLVLCLALLLCPIWAQAQMAIQQEIALLPPAPGPHPDLDDLMEQFWHDYWKADGDLGIGPQNIRVGRADLNDDDDAELFLLIDRPAWRGSDGKPFVVAQWEKGRWKAIGWGWTDQESLWMLQEKLAGWHSIDADHHIMRWAGRAYERSPKNPS